jgi:uncharacterized protein YndB with AHSA1/START domain
VDIDREAPATAEGERRIDAPPDTVFAVLADLERWPSWNPGVRSVTVEGPVAPGTVFRWRAGATSLTSTLQVVDPPHEITWTGTTMGIRAVHTFRLEGAGGRTLARSEESWDGVLPRLLKGYSRRTLATGITKVLAALQVEAERRGAGP